MRKLDASPVSGRTETALRWRAHEETGIPGAGSNRVISGERLAARCPLGQRAERRRGFPSIPSPAGGPRMALGKKLVRAQPANERRFGGGAVAAEDLSGGASRRGLPRRLPRAE